MNLKNEASVDWEFSLKVMAALIALLGPFLYFSGALYESYYFDVFGVSRGVFSTSVNELLVTGGFALAAVIAEYWLEAAVVAFILALVALLSASAHEIGWLSLFEKKRALEHSEEKKPLPEGVRLFALLASSSLLLLCVLLILVLATGYYSRGIQSVATRLAEQKAQVLSVDRWGAGVEMDRTVFLAGSERKLEGRRLVECSDRACIFATAAGYEVILTQDIVRISPQQ